MPIDRLMKLAADFKVPLPELTAAGLADLDISARGQQTNLSEAKVTGSLLELTANNEEGSLASDKLSMHVDASVRGSTQQWAFDVAIKSSQGQAFAQPILRRPVGACDVSASAGQADGWQVADVRSFHAGSCGCRASVGKRATASWIWNSQCVISM